MAKEATGIGMYTAKQRPPKPPGRIAPPGTQLNLAMSVAVVVLGAIALYLRLRSGPLTLDDAYISMRYARNLAQGHGLTFNVGQRVMGASCPLWLLILSFVSLLHIDLPTFSCYAGGAFDAITTGLLVLLGLRVIHPLAGLLMGTIYALSCTSVIIAATGMETPLFLLLAVACTFLTLSGRYIAASVCSGLLGITRPEGVIFILALLIALAIRERRFPATAASFSIAPLAVWTAFSWVYYGSPFPHSIVAKEAVFPPQSGHGYNALMMLKYISEPGSGYPRSPHVAALHIATVIITLLGAASVLRKSHAAGVLIVATALIYAAYALTNRFMFWWYYNLLQPGALLAQAAGIYEILRNLFRLERLSGLRRSAVIRVLAISPVVGAICFTMTAEAIRQPKFMQREIASREALYGQAAIWMTSNHPELPPVTIHEIGAFGYNYPGKLFDLYALVSPLMDGYWRMPPGQLRGGAKYVHEQRPRYFFRWVIDGNDTMPGYPEFLHEYRPAKSWSASPRAKRVLVLYEPT